MNRKTLSALTILALAVIPITCGSPDEGGARATPKSTDYADLVQLFQEFRELVEPNVINDVPDYTAAAMEAQRQRLEEQRSRLDAIDPSGWPIPQRADYLLVRAEFNGLEFQHRVMRPWARDPGLYLNNSAMSVFGALYDALTGGRTTDSTTVEVPGLPLPEEIIAGYRSRLKAVPQILEQGKGNLTEVAGGLARVAIRAGKRDFDWFYADVMPMLSQYHPDLEPEAQRAHAAIEGFREWLEENVDEWTAPAGIGSENYNWFLKNVMLLPYTLEEVRLIGEREYERAMAFLATEENRNRDIPKIVPITTEEEYRRAVDEANQHIVTFLRERQVMTVPADYIAGKPDAKWALRDGPDSRPGGQRNFFQTSEDYDPRALQSHITVPGHHFDGYYQRRNEHPIRGVRRLFGIDSPRSNWAFYVEEMLIQAGLYDERPRSREVVYVLTAMRAARTPAELKLHTNEAEYEDVLRLMAELAPYWLYEDDTDLVDELGGYLRRPGAGIGYLFGMVQIQQLISDRRRQLGDQFSLLQFHDDFLKAGRIPIALMRWEMTGLDDQVKDMW